MALEQTISPVTDADGIALSQTPGAAGNLTLAGALASGGTVTLTDAQHVTITSAADETGRTFTVTGTDRYGDAQTEAITGANAGEAEGSKNFKTITQIAVDAATTGAVTAGVNGNLESRWVSLDQTKPWRPASIAVVNGTSTYGAQVTYADTGGEAADSLDAFNHATVTNETGSVDGTITAPVSAVRIDVTAFTSGTLKLYINQ